MDNADAIVLTGEYSIVIVLSCHVSHDDIVDSVLRDVISGVFAVVIQIIDKFASCPYPSVLHGNVLYRFSERGCKLEEFFPFLGQSNDSLAVREENL